MNNLNMNIIKEKITFKKKKASLKYDNSGYLFILPFYTFMLIGIVLPIFISIFLSFTDYDLRTINFIGLRNYMKILDDSHFLISLKNTFIYTFFTLFISMILGLAAALVLVKHVFGSKFFMTSFYIPYIPSMVSITMVWLWIFEPSHGMLNDLFAFLGLKGRDWLFDVDLAMGCIIIVSIWKIIGYNMIIYISGLFAIPRYLYEAAEIDGASYWESFYHITLPLLRPVTFFLFVTGFINNFKVFEQVQIMTQGGPMNSTTTVIHQIYYRGFREFQMGYSSALSVVTLIIIAIVTMLNFKYGNQGNDIDI